MSIAGPVERRTRVVAVRVMTVRRPGGRVLGNRVRPRGGAVDPPTVRREAAGPGTITGPGSRVPTVVRTTAATLAAATSATATIGDARRVDITAVRVMIGRAGRAGIATTGPSAAAGTHDRIDAARRPSAAHVTTAVHASGTETTGVPGAVRRAGATGIPTGSGPLGMTASLVIGATASGDPAAMTTVPETGRSMPSAGSGGTRGTIRAVETATSRPPDLRRAPTVRTGGTAIRDPGGTARTGARVATIGGAAGTASAVTVVGLPAGRTGATGGEVRTGGRTGNPATGRRNATAATAGSSTGSSQPGRRAIGPIGGPPAAPTGRTVVPTTAGHPTSV